MVRGLIFLLLEQISTQADIAQFSLLLPDRRHLRHPQLQVAQQNAIKLSVDNPFYHYLTEALCHQPTSGGKRWSWAMSAGTWD
jgi:hypothetical protein